MEAATLPRAPVSSSSASSVFFFRGGRARPNSHAGAAGWRRREPYPAVSVAAGPARSPPEALAVDPKGVLKEGSIKRRTANIFPSKLLIYCGLLCRIYSQYTKNGLILPDDDYKKQYKSITHIDENGPVMSVKTLLDSVKWDSKGLAVAIAQNVDTGAILMQGFANKEALATTISTRKATFYSRSRSSLWTKGETSMNFINVHDIFLDCDRDSIIYLGKPDGPTCHTGAETCYYSSVYDALQGLKANQDRQVATTLYSLEDTISRRKEEIITEGSGKPSWTKKLLLDNQLLCSKIHEEAGELTQTLLENEDKSRTASEMADLLYHAMVLLRVKDVKMDEVLEVLRKRFSQSGIEEKASR